MEKEKYRLDGVVISLNTPFDENDRVDFASLERLVETHLREGAIGFLTTAQAAEVYELTFDERVQIVSVVKSVVGDRVAVIAGATAQASDESYKLAEEATRIGCEGVLVEVPSRDNAERAVSTFVESFASIGMPMLMLQDLDWNGPGLATNLISDLFERVEPFKCLKIEVTPSGPKYTAVIEATRGRLHVSGGWASLQMIEALDRGVDAFVPTSMTKMFAAVMGQYRANKRERAKEVFQSMLPVLAFTRQHLDVSIHFHKMLYHSRGVFRTPTVRKRSHAFDARHARYAEELIKYLDQLEDGLSNLRSES